MSSTAWELDDCNEANTQLRRANKKLESRAGEAESRLAALRAFRDELTSQYGMRYEGSWLVGRLNEILGASDG